MKVSKRLPSPLMTLLCVLAYGLLLPRMVSINRE
jgi:hypothetical protein